jgi:hypothetical protein
VGFHEALRHLLYTLVGVTLDPSGSASVELQPAIFHRLMIALADITKLDDAIGQAARAVVTVTLTLHALTLRAALSPGASGNRKSHGIPCSIRWQPSATRGVAEITEFFQRRPGWDLAFMPRRCAVPAPSSPERKPRRMLPSPILKFIDGHEKRAGHSLASSDSMEIFSEGAIVLTATSARQFCLEERGN